MFILTVVAYCFDDCNFVENFAIEKYESCYFILFQNCFGYLGPFHFYINCKISLSISEKDTWEFDRKFIEIIEEFGEFYHLNNLNVLIPEH